MLVSQWPPNMSLEVTRVQQTKTQCHMHSNWAFQQLRQFIEYKAQPLAVAASCLL